MRRAALALGSVWVLVFMGCIVKTVYADHVILVAQVQEMKTKFNELTKKLSDLERSKDESSQNGRTQAIRAHLAMLIKQGVEIRDQMDFSSSIPLDKLLRWHNWESEAERFLRENLDSADAESFRSYDVKGFPPKQNIMNQIGYLEEILNQTR